MTTFSNKTVLITGAAGGIGRACVEAFGAEGANVVMTDVGRTPDWAGTLDAERAVFIAADLCDPAAVERMVNDAAARFGSLDVLVNNAAVFTPMAAVHETSVDQFDLLIKVNLRGPFLCCKYAHPHLVKARGNIVNVSSMAGVTGEANHAAYSAAKGGLNLLTKAMAIDYGSRGIRCNAVCPSSVITPNTDKLVNAAKDPPRVVEMRKEINHLRCTASPSEIASVVLFLASPAASFMTGAVVPVSGGSECGYGVKPPA